MLGWSGLRGGAALLIASLGVAARGKVDHFLQEQVIEELQTRQAMDPKKLYP